MVAIVAILLGLLLPALLQNRTRGRRSLSTNNLKNLGIALQSYHDAYRAYPGYANVVAGKRASWVVTLLPQFEHQDLHRLYQIWQSTPPVRLPLPASTTPTRLAANKSAMNPWPYDRLSVLICPSDSNLVSQGNPLSYVANCGSARTANDFFPSPIADTSWIEDVNSGIFFNHARADLALGRAEANPSAADFAATPGAVVSMAIKKVRDGTSKTLACCENLQAGTWVTDPTDTSRAPGPFQSEFQIRQMTGFVWFITGNKDNALPAPADAPYNPAALGVNLPRRVATPIPYARYPVPGSNPPTGGLAYARPSSGHQNGANFLFCDGSVQFLLDDLDYKVYTQLMTPNSAGVIVNTDPRQTAEEAGWTYQLKNPES